MPRYYQYNEDGKITGFVTTPGKPPVHPRQIVDPAIPDGYGLSDWVIINGKITVDEAAIAQREKQILIEQEIRKLAEQKISEVLQDRPADWDTLSTQEKTEHYLNFTKSQIDAIIEPKE